MSFLSDLQAAVVRPRRAIGEIQAAVTIEEHHIDELQITEHPVEQGAAITDHAFKRPAEVTLKTGWSNSGSILDPQSLLNSWVNPNYIAEIYQSLLALQEGRIPFDIITGKRKYSNMLLRSLTTTTNQETEHCLIITATCRQIIIVQSRIVTVPPQSQQRSPEQTAPVLNKGTQQPNRSALFNFVNP